MSRLFYTFYSAIELAAVLGFGWLVIRVGSALV